MMRIKKNKRMRRLMAVMLKNPKGMLKTLKLRRPSRSHLMRNRSRVPRQRNSKMKRRKNSASATSLTIISNCLGSTYPSAMMRSGLRRTFPWRNITSLT